MADSSSKELKDQSQDRKRKTPMSSSCERLESRIALKSLSLLDGNELPALPEPKCLRDLIDSERCSKPFMKQISETDESQKRLTLNKEFVEKHYLGMLSELQTKKVIVYGPNGKGYGMTFHFLRAEGNYVLSEGWFDFANEHGLESLVHWVTIWMFRRKNSNDVCFAITWKYFPRRLGLGPLGIFEFEEDKIISEMT